MNQAKADRIRVEFGKVVRERRTSLDLSQEELAFRSGLHRTYTADIERGARNPSMNSLLKLADGLGVPLSDLFSRVEKRMRGE